jgi:hypothetical protein
MDGNQLHSVSVYEQKIPFIPSGKKVAFSRNSLADVKMVV